MKRLIAAIVAGMFAVAATAPVIAQEKKADPSKMTDAQKAEAKKKAQAKAATMTDAQKAEAKKKAQAKAATMTDAQKAEAKKKAEAAKKKAAEQKK
jgi:hypothetical protein